MKTSEMIAMLEDNPKLKFRRETFDPVAFITLDVFGHLINGYTKEPWNIVLSSCDQVIDNWQLVREPVPVWEAIKAVTEGKTAVCEYTQEYNPVVRAFRFSKDDLKGFAFHADLIISGTWYIEDPSNES